MQITLALAALATVASAAVGSSPTAPAPAGCASSYDGAFQITIVSVDSPLKVKRQSTTCGQSGYLTVTLADGILTDSENRQGEIVANYQFQFDNPLQNNAVYTEGFSVCSNGSLALGGTNVFYECETFGGPGIGNYSNLYSQSTGAQCNPILIDIIPCADPSSSTVVAGQSGDGQVTVTGTPAAPVSQISDGQLQGTTVAPKPTCVVSQISDGQVQVTICPTPSPTACVVSQISDGQLQYTSCPTTAAPVSQISDGQIQATATATTTAVPVSQISDGQIQATATATTTAVPVSQISDGQIQATATATITPVPVSQISDGQIQATTVVTKASSSLAVVSQISDGQIEATSTSKSNVTATNTPVPVSANLGNGMSVASSLAAVMVGFAAVLLL
jgi:hypothetical protein